MHCTVARRAVTMVAVPVLLVILSACSSAAGSRTLPGIAAPAGMPVSGTTSPLASPAAGGSVPASPAPGSPAPGSPTPAGATSAVPSSAGWAKTTQFLQIKGSGEAGGVEYLEVRQATQKPVGESFKTVPLDEAWIKVTISALAQNAPLYAKAGDSRQLRAALAERSASEVDEGFDVTFDQSGHVRKVAWLYQSVRERDQETVGDWAGTTQFLQIKSARETSNVTYLTVRPAAKQILGESFETVTIGGPWTEVVMSALASNVPLKGEQADADALRAALAKRPASEADEGFDISFFGNGEVKQVTWLYVLG